jgi:glutamate-1-semialdehyde 2,1-aminomutase/spore coat polysaccharide biosynthesis protein SpsF
VTGQPITAVVVQARIGSARLPGKVLRDLGGRPVLARVLARCKRIPGADVVVCAVPDEPGSVALEDIARAEGCTSVRGSERDVLDRYLEAARAARARVVMRVTSDCPLIDPEVCGKVLALRATQRADYGCNNMPRTFPHGLDCEAFTAPALERAAAEAVDPYDREHVTPWLRRAAGLKRVNFSSGRPALARHRWTLDYPEDLAFFEAVFAALPDAGTASFEDILALLARRPEIAAINASRATA